VHLKRGRGAVRQRPFPTLHLSIVGLSQSRQVDIEGALRRATGDAQGGFQRCVLKTLLWGEAHAKGRDGGGGRQRRLQAVGGTIPAPASP